MADIEDYRARLRAVREDEDIRRQQIQNWLSTPSGMGQTNKPIEAYMMLQGKMGAGPKTTDALGAFSRANLGGKPLGLKSEEERKNLINAQFVAKYGASPEDIMEGYKAAGIADTSTPGGPATQRTGMGMEIPAIDVGQRFRAGEKVTETEPETAKLSPYQQRAKAGYEDVKNRMGEMMEMQKQYYSARALAASRGGEDRSFSNLVNAIKLENERLKTLPEGPEKELAKAALTDMSNRMKQQVGGVGTPYMPPTAPAKSAKDYIPFMEGEQEAYERLYGPVQRFFSPPAAEPPQPPAGGTWPPPARSIPARKQRDLNEINEWRKAMRLPPLPK
jgi:hypothetical protein